MERLRASGPHERPCRQQGPPGSLPDRRRCAADVGGCGRALRPLRPPAPAARLGLQSSAARRRAATAAGGCVRDRRGRPTDRRAGPRIRPKQGSGGGARPAARGSAQPAAQLAARPASVEHRGGGQVGDDQAPPTVQAGPRCCCCLCVYNCELTPGARPGWCTGGGGPSADQLLRPATPCPDRRTDTHTGAAGARRCAAAPYRQAGRQAALQLPLPLALALARRVWGVGVDGRVWHWMAPDPPGPPAHRFNSAVRSLCLTHWLMLLAGSLGRRFNRPMPLR